MGLPVRLEVSGGEVSDYKGYDLLYDGDGPTAKVLIADRIREDCQANGGATVIPGRRNRKASIEIDSFIYAFRNQVERCFNKLKTARRVATRYDKTACSYLGFLHIAAVRLWFRSM